MNSINERRVKCAKENYRGRTIAIYGAGKNLRNIKEKIEKFADNIVIIDTYKYDDKKIFSPQILKGLSCQYYVVVSVIECQNEIFDLLEQYGYKEIKDYNYLLEDSVPDFKVIIEEYQDLYGNKVVGKLNGAKVRFLGYNSIINVGESFRGEELEITVSSGASIEIGDRVNVKQKVSWILGDNSNLHIGSKARWLQKGGSIFCEENAACHIGNNCSFRNDFFRVNCNTKLRIGDNSLFASNVNIRTNDGHAIYDLKTGECLNDARNVKREVILGEHVWIGQDVTVLYNTVIGNGSIVGAGSLVKGRFPNNCVIAGVPARIVKTDVAWSGRYLENGLLDIPEQYRRFTEDKELKGL